MKALNAKNEVMNLRSEISRLKILNTSITLGTPIYPIDMRSTKTSYDFFDLSGSQSRSDGEASSSVSILPYVPAGLAGGLKAAQVMQMLAD